MLETIFLIFVIIFSVFGFVWFMAEVIAVLVQIKRGFK